MDEIGTDSSVRQKNALRGLKSYNQHLPSLNFFKSTSKPCASYFPNSEVSKRYPELPAAMRNVALYKSACELFVFL